MAADVREAWDSFKGKKSKQRTGGTLKHYARQQRPAEYAERFPRVAESDYSATTNMEPLTPDQRAEGDRIRDAALYSA